ncbi:MAG: DUF2848 family protein [Streptosporangiaceae bacterium]
MRIEYLGPRGSSMVDVQPSMLLLAGYTGRDQAAVAAHVAELADHGIAPPPRIPAAYAASAARMTMADQIWVGGRQTSGEAEFVLMRSGDRWLVGVGSDHTDRALESQSIAKAKQSCDKPVSRAFWDLADVREHWDELTLTAWVGMANGEVVYQSGRLADLMTPEAIRADLAARVPGADGAAIFSGTLPVIGGEFAYGSSFRAELTDPVLGRSLRCGYRVGVLPELD